MAVQAQYPSNALFLNSKNAQEAHDYSLQSPPVELLDHHQSHMLFNNGGTSSRKRGRETTGIAPNVVNSFSLQQSQSPQLIDLTQLHNQNNVVSTGLRLSFGDQQQLHHQHQQQHHGYHSNTFESLLSEDLSSQIKQQRDEIDQFLQAQGEQLRRALAEKRQRHYRTLVRTAEEVVLRRLREKEAEVERVTRRNAELEARAAQLSMEAQVWEAKAKAQEAAAAALQAQLQRAMMGEEGGGGGLSCTGGDAEDAESAYVDPDRVGPKCRGCAQRLASVVVLPCRHLCICAQCDTNFRACPVCLTVKNSAVQVFLS